MIVCVLGAQAQSVLGVQAQTRGSDRSEECRLHSRTLAALLVAFGVDFLPPVTVWHLSAYHSVSYDEPVSVYLTSSYPNDTLIIAFDSQPLSEPTIFI